jgi:hypothetical protein
MLAMTANAPLIQLDKVSLDGGTSRPSRAVAGLVKVFDELTIRTTCSHVQQPKMLEGYDQVLAARP